MTNHTHQQASAQNQDKVAIVTGASRGIGASVARRLASDGFTVIINYAGRAADANAVVDEIRSNGGRAEAIQADVSAPAQVAALFDQTESLFGGVDVLVNNAGIMQPGLVSLSDTDDALFDKIVSVNLKGVFNTMRIAASSSSAGGTLPYLAPYFAAKAGMDALATQYARELALWGIETSIIVPGAFTSGANHFANAGTPADTKRAAEYEAGPYKGYGKKIQEAFAAIVPPDADVGQVADAIVKVIDLPFGKRPFRVYADPTQDGAEITFAVMDRVRAEMLHRVGLAELLTPARVYRETVRSAR